MTSSTNHAAEETTKSSFFLPKSPTAAAYVLGRLSNKELTEAPRSEFVYVALLKRKGLERKYRVEALEGLAKARNTDPLTELIGGLRGLDQKGEDSEPVLRDLAVILLQTKPADLAAKRSDLEKLATEAQLPLTRQMAYAAVITADGSADRTWPQVASDSAKLSDVLLAIPLLRDTNLRAALYPKVQPLLPKAEPAEVHRASIAAIAAVPGHDAETFNTLAALVQSGTEREAAVASLQKLPRKSWPREQAAMLIENLVGYLQSVPVDKRTEPEALGAFQFATDLTTLLPLAQAGAVSKTLRGLGVSVFVVRTIPEQMLYDQTLIVVEAGKPVAITLINDDAMPHNLVVVTPGAVEEIGTAAEKMPPEPDAQGRHYTPDSPKVLHGTKLVDPGQQSKLSFLAPEVPGEYPYVCTFPGHWRRMVGTLAVVPDVEVYLASHATADQPKVTEWKVEDLAPDLGQVSSGRNLARGKALFTKLACAGCHQLGVEGISYGPDLTDLLQRYQTNRADILRQILEPSLVISNRYRNIQFELKNGDELLGLIVQAEGERLTVQSGPSAALIQTLKLSDIKTQQPQSSSPMPLGLLNLLSKEEVFDLLAYLESGGQLPAHEHQH
ncbi:MAG: c-type cytochrome [Verrucomicrobiota bacterium]|nr:c-type cytochrome [Verrucomicrobiota bacterium]MCC6819672.1 c-type cytochrome [Limisphaerales bacterium]